ncbi:MAG TPA: helix-turn-helix domain-containing protein [Solirubrobacterales bacterium]|nr:helix-turn-helix domain-containing protein [Solirubrobacterales bacterium]
MLVEQAVAWLSNRLPQEWEVERVPLDPEQEVDARLTLRAGGFIGSILVETRAAISPRDVSGLLSGFARSLRSITPGTALLVIAPWLSERTREALAGEEINYVDLTGNARIHLPSPALYIETVGAARNPAPETRSGPQLRGTKAARLIRLLADVAPPYGVRELADAAELTPGYVSRLLDTLYREALVERSSRGGVESVDVPGILRRWATSYDVFKTNEASSYVAPMGLPRLLSQLESNPAVATKLAVTGSFAARRLAPVSRPALLLAYCDSPAPLAEMLELLPADEAADVMLLRPFDRSVWLRATTEDGTRYVAPSQVAVDCLTGNGRMPAEGEALLEWMIDNEPAWRASSLGKLTSPTDR